MGNWDHIAEQRIREAIEAGKFKDLPGAGRRLRLTEDPHGDPAWRTAHRLLQTNGFAPAWIELRQEIERSLEAARADLHRSWTWFQSRPDARAADWPEGEWARARRTFAERVTEINEHIFRYNLQVPSLRFHRTQIDPEREIDRLTNPTDAGAG